MKDAEDEAFDDLAKRQGNWGGGFPSKRAMAADKLWDKPSVAFDEWWNGDNDESTNPFRLESGAYWAWAGWKAALAQPPLPVQRQPLTGEQAKKIFRMARELEDTGRLTSLSEGAEREAFLQKNREIQCAIEDYLRNITETTPPLPVQPVRPWVGLTAEDILALFDEHNLYGSKLVEFARAVETKIKEKNNG